MNGVRVYWFLLAGLANAVLFIGVALAVAVFHGRTFARVHATHVSPALVDAGMVVISVVVLVVAKSVERPLDGGTDASLIATYRARFFLWVGLGEVPFFVSIAAVAATDRFWPYLIGAACALVGYGRIAPTPGHLARDQEQIDRHGPARSLVAALSTMPGRAPGRR
jgi:hypothetical protein